MRKFQLLSMLLLPTFTLMAQPKLSKDFIVTNSEPFQVVDAESKLYISDNANFSYSVKTDDGIVTLQKFDFLSMKEVGRKEYKDLPDKNIAVDLINLDGKLIYFYQGFDKKADKNSLYAQYINEEGCSFGNEIKLITTEGESAATIDPERVPVFRPGKSQTPTFKLYYSIDSSKILINYRRKPLKKNDSENYDLLGFYVFDAALNQMWGREVKMPYTEEEMNNLSYAISADGSSVYMMMLHRIEKQFKLLTIKNCDEVIINNVDDNAFFYQQLYMQETKNENLNFFGFYARGLKMYFSFNIGLTGYSYKTDGFRFFKMSKTGEIINSSNTEFPLDLINQYASSDEVEMNTKEEEKDKAGIRDLQLRAYHVYNDGSIFVLGEQYYVQSNYNGQTGSTVTTFFYEDLIAMRLDPKGNILWIDKLPKSQLGRRGRGGMGISYLESKENHYILFLDNVNNANLEKDEGPSMYDDGKGGYLTAYKVNDATGEWEKYSIYNSQEINGIETYQFQTSRIFRATDDELLVELYVKRKKDMMFKMKLVE